MEVGKKIYVYTHISVGVDIVSSSGHADDRNISNMVSHLGIIPHILVKFITITKYFELFFVVVKHAKNVELLFVFLQINQRMISLHPSYVLKESFTHSRQI